MSGIKPPKNLFDGQYPSEELLDWIKGYDCCHEHKVSRLLKVVKKVWHVRPFRNIYEEQIRVSVMTDHVLEWSTIHYGRETINNQNQITEQ